MAKALSLLAFVPVAAALSAAAAPLPLLQPTGKWKLEYGPSACAAVRLYAGAKGPITLGFRPSPNGTVVRLVVLRAGKGPAGMQFPVKTNIVPDAAKTTGLHFGPKGEKRQIVWINVPRTSLETLRRTGELSLNGGPLKARFALPIFGQLLDGLDACNADLRRYWNVGEHAAAIAKPAEPLKPLATYFSSGDYPAQAYQDDASGRSQIMMMIDEAGALKDCMVEETSGIAVLDAQTCILLHERAKFRPALDDAGKPVRSVLTQRVHWKMGE